MSKKGVDYLVVLDFEATCSEQRPAPRPQEIIEFPSLLLNVRTGQVEHTFHYYIKPDVNPTLSAFCTELTGITQEQVDAGISLDRALVLHREWIDEIGVVPASSTINADSQTYLYLTCGDWDLKTCLPTQLQYHSKKVPSMFKHWINVKHEFQHVYGTKAGGMTGMLKKLKLDLQGRHHSGIDDCRNIARICSQMLADGWVPTVESSSFVAEEPLQKRVKIVTYGKHNGKPAEKFDLHYNCSNIPNPSKSSRKNCTGLDKRLRTEVLAERGARDMISRSVEEIVQLSEKEHTITVGYACEMGKHRSVAVGIAAASILKKKYKLHVELIHRDVAAERQEGTDAALK